MYPQLSHLSNVICKSIDDNKIVHVSPRRANDFEHLAVCRQRILEESLLAGRGGDNPHVRLHCAFLHIPLQSSKLHGEGTVLPTSVFGRPTLA